MNVLFGLDGSARMIYSDELAEVGSAIGTVATRRASSVEPTKDGQWTADLAQCGGPFLGPYKTRAEALIKEREWLIENNIPIPFEVTNA